MDRNAGYRRSSPLTSRSLSARRAWIEIFSFLDTDYKTRVALRKESVDRNRIIKPSYRTIFVALRKESVDRNMRTTLIFLLSPVALRKESVDRNSDNRRSRFALDRSLSARRAWIEITSYCKECTLSIVALRKESVDRNPA